jgi:hypothetical protein
MTAKIFAAGALIAALGTLTEASLGLIGKTQPLTCRIGVSFPWCSVRIRVHGNLQLAQVDETYPPGQFAVPVTKGVVFDTKDVLLHVDQLIGDKVCRTKVVTSDSLLSWTHDDMKVFCSIRDPKLVECVVEPVYFTKCQ